LNDPRSVQLEIDFRTGLLTAISGEHVDPVAHAACSAINRGRIRGIQKAARTAAPRKSTEDHVWHAAVAARANKLQVPLIPLERFGFKPSDEDFAFGTSPGFPIIGWGAEAHVYCDPIQRCVYKFFHLHLSSALGKKLDFIEEPDGRFRATSVDGNWESTLEKLDLLHDAGGCPTEILGLAESGDYLIAKQPFCRPYEDFQTDLGTAADRLCAVLPRPSLGHGIRVFWLRGRPWCVGDLHDLNIMRLASGEPVIIDALTGPVPEKVLRRFPSIYASLSRARALREGTALPPDELPAGGTDDEL
jgi:hypothetical protein